MTLFHLLRRPHLATLWASQVLSLAGDHLYTVAVVWIAVNAAGSRAGLVIAAGTVARLAFGLLGGVLADRWERRRTLIAVDLIRAAAVGALPVVQALGGIRLWHLALATVIIGGLGTLFDPALQASLPGLVGDRSRLVAMNGLMDGTRRLALALAPSFAGVLVGVLPLPQFFTLDAISFGVSAAAIIAIRRHFTAPAAPAQRGQGSVRSIAAEIADAFRLVHARPLLGWFIATNGVSNIAWAAAFQVGAPLLAARALGGNAGALGLILGAYGAGNIASNLVVGSLTIRRRALMLALSRVTMGAGFAILALAPSLPVALAGSAVAAIGGPMGDLTLLAMLHHDIPEGQFGKVYALRLTTGNTGMTVGLLVAGPLFAALPVGAGIGICAAVIAALGIAALLRFGTERSAPPDTPAVERTI